jgi:arginyl-tRNA synthetase
MEKDLIKKIQRITGDVFRDRAREATADIQSFPTIEIEQKDPSVFGDFSTSAAFLYAPILKKSPLDIAQEIPVRITKRLQQEISSDSFAEVAGNGFINYHIGPRGWADIAQKLSSPRPRKRLFRKKILIEFSSPNIAKPMHIGHLRATILGNALVHLYRHAGYKPVSWNHIGDWGTQFGKLLVAIKRWGDESIIRKNPIAELQKLYVEFHRVAEHDSSLEKEAQEAFAQLESGNKKHLTLWKFVVRESLREFNRLYRLLAIKFNYIIGESFYEPMLKPFIDRLKASGVAQKSEGAYIIPLDNANLPPALIQKSDGATLYLTRDLVSLAYRARKIKPTRMLYVVGGEQILHFKQLRAVNELLHLTSVPFEHISFGLVLNARGKKFSTRSGDMIAAQDILNETIIKAAAIQKEKQSSSLHNASSIQTLALGVITYSMLKNNRTSDIAFDFDDVFSLSGNSFPYLQYTYARLQSIRLKNPTPKKSDYSLLTTEDWALVRVLIAFEKTVDACIKANSLHFLADYLFDLANTANTLYEKHHITTDQDTQRKNARLNLIIHTITTLRYGLSLMGMRVQERM